MRGCKEFEELLESGLMDIRTGCVAIKIRKGEGQCIDDSGPVLRFCPYCGHEIKAKYDPVAGGWEWWHD